MVSTRSSKRLSKQAEQSSKKEKAKQETGQKRKKVTEASKVNNVRKKRIDNKDSKQQKDKQEDTKKKQTSKSNSTSKVTVADTKIYTKSEEGHDNSLLLDLVEAEGELVEATMVCRPSARNKSPYVCDVKLADGRIAVAHAPSMELGGKCVPGVTLLMKHARDKKGNKVTADAKSAKYGTPKCEFILQLVFVVDRENPKGCWVGAHPSLGEKLAKAILQKQLASDLPEIASFQSEVVNICGADMRTDVVANHTNEERRTVIEVKTVVDTDYNIENKDYYLSSSPTITTDQITTTTTTTTTPTTTTTTTTPTKKKKAKKAKVIFFGRDKVYERAGIFPWGNSKQKGPDGEAVVSARAIKHVRSLTKIAKGELLEKENERLNAAVIFIVIREDAKKFRPNVEACPSFAKYLAEASKAGVTVMAFRIMWGKGDEKGKAYFGGKLPIEL